MGIPLIQQARIGAYLMKKRIQRQHQYPLVLMLEPLFQCNLRCQGCGKISHPPEILKKQLDHQACLDAAEECGAPVVSIAGGEPLLHPEMAAIAASLVDRKKFVYLCTNALLLTKHMGEFNPSPYLTFSVHLDAMRERHDSLVSREGVFDCAVDAIKQAIAHGFRVTTNTTFYSGETPENAAAFLDFVTSLGVEGMTIAPGFGYETAADQDQFLGREGTVQFFQELFALRKGRSWQFNHSPRYLDFLAGRRDYACTPWGNPTRNIFGWQRPCYLLDDGYADSFKDLMENTDWSRYGVNLDPRCQDCMMHCGFEPSAVLDTVLHPFKGRDR